MHTKLNLNKNVECSGKEAGDDTEAQKALPIRLEKWNKWYRFIANALIVVGLVSFALGIVSAHFSKSISTKSYPDYPTEITWIVLGAAWCTSVGLLITGFGLFMHAWLHRHPSWRSSPQNDGSNV